MPFTAEQTNRSGTHAHNSGKQGHGPALDAFGTLEEMPSSDVLVFPITAPWSYRRFVPLLRDVLKSTMIEKELLLLIEDFKGLAHSFSGFLKEVSPAVEDVAWGNGAVICRPSNGVLNLLIPPTRFEMSTVT